MYPTYRFLCQVHIPSIQVDVPLVKAPMRDHLLFPSVFAVRKDKPSAVWCSQPVPDGPEWGRLCQPLLSLQLFLDLPPLLAYFEDKFIRHSGRNVCIVHQQIIFSLLAKAAPVNGKHSLKNLLQGWGEVGWGKQVDLSVNLLFLHSDVSGERV